MSRKGIFVAAVSAMALMLAGCSLIRGKAGDGEGMPDSNDQISQDGENGIEDYGMDPVAYPLLRIGDVHYSIDLESNSSAEAFFEKIKKDPLTIEMHDYGGFEKVGDLPWELPAGDEEITAQPGDIILYQGNKLTIYYGENTWNFTKIGCISGVDTGELREILGDGDVTVEFWAEWTE